MKHFRFLAPAAAVIVLLGAAVLPAGNRANAAGGATLALGAITFDGTNVRVPVVISGSGFDPYSGVTSVLLWNPAVFSFSSADTTGTVIPSPFCATGTASSSTGPHSGVSDGENVGCASLAGTTSSTGLAVTFVLTPISGCSSLHLLTLSPPDSDAEGSATLDALGGNQVNTYGTIDATADVTGQACTPGALPTPTSTAVPPTPVPPNTATPEGTPIRLRTVTPSATASPTGVAGAPTQPPASTPSPTSGLGSVPPAGAGVAGAGTIKGPDTGTGGGGPAPTTRAIGLVALLAAGGLGLSGVGYVWRRRSRA